MITRILNLKQHLEEKSVLLLGPRRTGKSYYIKNQIKPDVSIDLLDSDTFRQYSYDPGSLKNLISNKKQIIAIDEIQKLPNLMNEVHSLIEKHKQTKFLLTGSSAKNLKHTHTSLMAGRARQINLFPLVYPEMKNHQFDLERFLHYGSMPDVYLSKNPWEQLKDYAGMYLKEEIQASAFVRKIENYSRFLEFSAHSNGQILNFEKMASDAQIPARTIKDYYVLLEETLIGYNLPPFRSKESRKEVATSKFYFFDTGIVNSLSRLKTKDALKPHLGNLFEHFIFLELKAFQSYNRQDWQIFFWRTKKDYEVDFILGQGEIAIEVKLTKNPNEDDLKGLKQFNKDYNPRRSILVCNTQKKYQIGRYEVLPWKDFLEMLWNKEIIEG